jgi:ATP-dependent DNA helicase RecG
MPPPASTLRLTTPLAEAPGIAAGVAEKLAAMGVACVGDLLRHLPLRYEEEHAETPIADAVDLMETQERANLSLRGAIAAVQLRGGRRSRVEAVLEDESGTVLLTWFNAPWLARRLHPGQEGIAEGPAKRFGPMVQLVNPRWTRVDPDEPPPARVARIRPIYPAREDLASEKIERAVAAVLDDALPQIVDGLPEWFRTRHELPDLAECYRRLHRPATLAEPVAARQRLALEELLLMQLAVAMRRHQWRSGAKAVPLPCDGALLERIRARLPFVPTPGQEKAIAEIAADLAGTAPMNRLLQGDVGSGKTAVAVAAMLIAVAAGRQALLIAPTELLAEQHAEVLGALLRGSEVRVGLLTGALVAAKRKALLEQLAAGELDLVIGTHALLSEGVAFRDLGLVIIDEQHRFGVSQRATLRAHRGRDGTRPHVLVMTATPIPRTLSLTLLGDLDVTTITDRPPGRQSPITRVVTPAKRPTVHGYLRERIEQGEQAFVVVPAIDESDLGLADVASQVRELRDGPWSGLRIEGLHGRMPVEVRDEVMERFRAQEIDALVATVVIEVGIDVPNATLMVVEHAERFGLAQLHQLRGRVARGTRRGLCVAVCEPTTPEAEARMEALASTDDGFRIAELDLEIRGPGELFGARQSGLAPLRVADLRRDLPLLAIARAEARAWIESSPDLGRPEEQGIRRKVFALYGEVMGLVEVA